MRHPGLLEFADPAALHHRPSRTTAAHDVRLGRRLSGPASVRLPPHYHPFNPPGLGPTPFGAHDSAPANRSLNGAHDGAATPALSPAPTQPRPQPQSPTPTPLKVRHQAGWQARRLLARGRHQSRLFPPLRPGRHAAHHARQDGRAAGEPLTSSPTSSSPSPSTVLQASPSPTAPPLSTPTLLCRRAPSFASVVVASTAACWALHWPRPSCTAST